MPEYLFEMSTDRLSLGGLSIQGKTFSQNVEYFVIDKYTGG